MAKPRKKGGQKKPRAGKGGQPARGRGDSSRKVSTKNRGGTTEKQVYKDPQGRFCSRRQWIAYQGWKTRRARAEAKRRRSEAARERAKNALRGKGGRFATPRQASAYKRELLKAKQRQLAEEKKRAKQAAAEKGWKTIRDKASGKWQPDDKNKPSAAIKAYFLDPSWLSGTWHEYKDGQQEGQVIIGAGLNSMLRQRLLYLAQALEDRLSEEPLWVELGFKFENLTADDYDRFGGMSYASLYPRRSEYIGENFFAHRELADNLIDAGADIKQLVVRVYYGERPERLGDE